MERVEMISSLVANQSSITITPITSNNKKSKGTQLKK
jgi:hypothetical protein